MPFSYTWDVAVPADTEDINLGAARIRTFKNAIQERFAVDHSFANNTSDGLHKHSEYIPSGSAPTLVNAADGVVYVAVVASVAELFYKDSAGHVLQLTTNGIFRLSDIIVTGALSRFLGLPATDLIVGVDTDVSRSGGLEFLTNGSPRILIRKNATPEAGGDTGSDLDVVVAHDNGTVIGTALRIYRANGSISLPGIATGAAPSVGRTLWTNGTDGIVRITPP